MTRPHGEVPTARSRAGDRTIRLSVVAATAPRTVLVLGTFEHINVHRTLLSGTHSALQTKPRRARRTTMLADRTHLERPWPSLGALVRRVRETLCREQGVEGTLD